MPFELNIHREVLCPSHFQLPLKTTDLALHASECACGTQETPCVGEWYIPKRAAQLFLPQNYTILGTKFTYHNAWFQLSWKCYSVTYALMPRESSMMK